MKRTVARNRKEQAWLQEEEDSERVWTVLIPETIKPAAQEKTKVVEKIVEKVVEKPVEQKVKLSKIGPREDQPRKQFDEDSLAELAESIKQFGVIQPLVVQEKNGFYEIIAGELPLARSQDGRLKRSSGYYQEIHGS